jgi:hypothetical protein
MADVGKAPTKRDLNDVFEVELNFIGRQRIGESIERRLQLGFKIFEYGYHFLDSRLIDQTAWSVDEQTNVFDETQRLEPVSSVARIVTKASSENEEFSFLTLHPSA